MIPGSKLFMHFSYPVLIKTMAIYSYIHFPLLINYKYVAFINGKHLFVSGYMIDLCKYTWRVYFELNHLCRYVPVPSRIYRKYF